VSALVLQGSQPFEELFLPNLGILWFQNPMVFFGKYKIYFYTHAVVQLESFWPWPIGTRKSFPPWIISIACSTFSTKLLNVV
jgi:hypothetical protein